MCQATIPIITTIPPHYTYPDPLAQLLGLSNRDEVDIMFTAQCLNQLLVVGAVAVLCQHTELGLATFNGTGCLMQTTRETVVREGGAEHTLDCGVEVHGLIGARNLCNRGSLSVCSGCMDG